MIVLNLIGKTASTFQAELNRDTICVISLKDVNRKSGNRRASYGIAIEG
jgi:hypothetical protein